MISLACFVNNVIHAWPHVVLIFDREINPGLTIAICLCCNFI